MTLLVVLPPLVVGLHLLLAMIFRRSQPGRRLLLALLLIALAYPLQMLGVVVGLGSEGQFAGLIRLCLFAPPLASVLSFLVYVPAMGRTSANRHPVPTANPQAQGE